MDKEGDYILEFPLYLPGPLVHLILCYLPVMNLGRLMQVSKTMRSWMISDGVLWRLHCQRVWLCDSKEEGQSWYEKWLSICAEWHPYINCYSRIKRTWMRINKFLQLKCPAALAQFNSGLTESDIEEIEKRLWVKVPPEYGCFLRLCDGMKCNVDGISFMGSVSSYGNTFQYALYDHRKMMALTQVVPMVVPRRKVIDPKNMMHVYMVIGGDVHDRSGQLLLSYSSREHKLNAHVFQVNAYLHSYAKPVTFSDWLDQEANQMELYSVDNQAIHRFLFLPEYVAVTGNFTVRVGTAFDPHQLDLYAISLIEEDIVDVRFVYRIEIFMADNVPYYECCRLESRHWVIKFSNGLSDVAEGPGVVGEQPSFKPGSCHKYASCIYFQTEWCSMEGYFTMKYHDIIGEFKIAIPKFTMYKPELSYLA